MAPCPCSFGVRGQKAPPHFRKSVLKPGPLVRLGCEQSAMGPLLVGARWADVGRVVVAGPVPAAASALHACLPWGLWSAGSRGACACCLEQLWGRLRLSAQFAVLCLRSFEKGAAGGHDDVCFAFGRNPAAADGRGLTGLWFEGQEHFGSTLLKEDGNMLKAPMRFLVLAACLR